MWHAFGVTKESADRRRIDNHTHINLPPHVACRQALWGRGTAVASAVDEGIISKSIFAPKAQVICLTA